MRGAGSLAARIVVTVGLLLVLAFVVAEPRELLARLAAATALPTLIALVLTVGDRVWMALKWRLLLRARGVMLSPWYAIRAYYASSFAGLFLPVTVGADLIRVLAVRQLGVQEVTASIIIERGLGAVAMGTVALGSCALLAASLTDISVRTMTWAALGLVVVGLTGLAASLSLASRWTARVERSSAMLGKLLAAYAGYRRHTGTLVAFYALSVGESLLPAVITYAAAQALDLRLPLTLFVATVPLSLTIARLPVTLGGFGLQEASFVYLAGLTGVSSTDALSAMLLTDALLVLALLPAALDSSMLGLRRQVVERPS